ncbi:MAG: 4Fe-4S binding protein [Candidatus Latescibacterota bacterium]
MMADRLALALLILFIILTGVSVREYEYVSFPLFWTAGMIPVALSCRSLSSILEMSTLLLVWIVFGGPSGETALPLSFVLLIAVALYTTRRMESRIIPAAIPVLGVFWLVLAYDGNPGGITGVNALLLLSALPGIAFIISENRKKSVPPRNVDVILCSFSSNTAHYTSHFIRGMEEIGAKVTVHRFHDHRAFHPELNGDSLVLCFPVYGWKPPWPLEECLLRRLPRGNGKPAFILYTCAGGPENAGVYTRLLLALRGYRVVGRNWAIYPVNIATVRLGPSGLWNYLDQLMPWEHEIARVYESGKDFALGMSTGMPFVLWPFPLVLAGILLDNPLLNRILYRNHVYRKRCVRCGICVNFCPTGRLHMNDLPKARGTCALCFGCVNLCPRCAMHIWCFTEYGNPYRPRWPEKLDSR